MLDRRCLFFLLFFRSRLRIQDRLAGSGDNALIQLVDIHTSKEDLRALRDLVAVRIQSEGIHFLEGSLLGVELL